MSDPTEPGVKARRALPRGLRICDDCGEVRGHARFGLSVCLCQGIECNHCGARFRRPISDYYDKRDRRWWHAGYMSYALWHRCPPGVRPEGARPSLTSLPMDDDVRAYQIGVSERARSEIRE